MPSACARLLVGVRADASQRRARRAEIGQNPIESFRREFLKRVQVVFKSLYLHEQFVEKDTQSW